MQGRRGASITVGILAAAALATPARAQVISTLVKENDFITGVAPSRVLTGDLEGAFMIAIPEPASATAMIGLVGAGAMIRRRRD